MLESSDKNVEEGVEGDCNQGALNANRKLSGGGGRKHRGIYEQVTDVPRLPSTAPPPPRAAQTTGLLYTLSSALNTLCVYEK
jgi:hypothetical protein